MSPGVEPIPLDSVLGLLCEVLGKAGQPEAVGEAVEVVERLEFSRNQAPRHLWREYDLAIKRAVETLRVVREHAPWRPPPLPPIVPRACEARWRRRRAPG